MVDILTSANRALDLRDKLTLIFGQILTRGRVMMVLGPYVFSVGTAAPQEMRHTADYGWPEQDRVGARPLLQWTGPKGEQIELDGVIYPHYRGGLEQVSAMREMASTGQRWLLVDGLGRVYGQYAIQRIEETGAVYGKYGAPRRINFNLQLARAEDAGYGVI